MRNYIWVLIIVAGLILMACGADVTLAPSLTPTARPTPTLAIAPTDTPASAPGHVDPNGDTGTPGGGLYDY